MKTTFSLLAIATVSLCASSALATSITVQNPSFETPTVAPYSFVNTGTTGLDWTISGPGSAVVQLIAGTFASPPAGGDQNQFGMTITYGNQPTDVEVWSQDLNVAFQPNATYTVDIDGAYRGATDPNITNVAMQFGLKSSISGSLGGPLGLIDIPNLPTQDVFVDAAAAGTHGHIFSFTTGAVAPLGDLVVFIQNVAGTGTPGSSGFRTQFDDVRVNVVPEPSSMLLLAVGLVGMWVVARKR